MTIHRSSSLWPSSAWRIMAYTSLSAEYTWCLPGTPSVDRPCIFLAGGMHDRSEILCLARRSNSRFNTVDLGLLNEAPQHHFTFHLTFTKQVRLPRFYHHWGNSSNIVRISTQEETFVDLFYLTWWEALHFGISGSLSYFSHILNPTNCYKIRWFWSWYELLEHRKFHKIKKTIFSWRIRELWDSLS